MVSCAPLPVRVFCVALAGGAAAGCGPEHGFSGAWKQNCDDPAKGGCGTPNAPDTFADGDFVYALHIGRYGDDVTGVAVRYLGSQPNDPTAECGCFLVQGGRATDETLNLTLKLTEDGNGGGPGCKDVSARYDPVACAPALRSPPCRELTFALTGDEDKLTGEAACDGVARPVEFVPASGKTRRNCLDPSVCPKPDAGTP